MKIVKKIIDLVRKYCIYLLPLLIIAVGFTFRYSIVKRDIIKLEHATGAKFAPYLVESAIMYGYINKVADGENISGADPALPAMKDIKASEQMSLFLEYAGGWLLRAKRLFCGDPPVGEYERSYGETGFLRTAFCLYIALSFGFIYIAMRFMKVPPLIALLAVAIEIFSAAALGRYTGQDFIKGAFAMPLLTAYIAAAAGAVYGSWRQRKIALILVFFTTIAAVAGWDASQLVIGLLAFCEIVRAIFTNHPSSKQRDLWCMTFIAMVISALLIPYNRLHGAFFSPVLQFLLPGAIAVNFIPRRVRRFVRTLPVIMLIIWSVLGSYLSPFAGNYGHFGELLQAKLKYGNVLPVDPEGLTFNIRYLWTPELHSATWKMTQMLFPGLMWCIIILWVFYLARNIVLRKNNRLSLAERVRSWELAKWLMLTVIAAVMYVYMARFRDITVLFAVFAVAVSGAALVRRSHSRVWYGIILLTLAGTVTVEWYNSCRLKRGYPQGLTQTAELIKYLRQYDLSGKTFLSDMQTSAFLKGYTNASILVQAKYELPAVRNLTEEFIMTFFHEDTGKFADFCQKNQTDYVLIHIPTITTSWKIPYSYCYISNTKRLKKHSAAGQLGIAKGSKNFYELALPASVKNAAGYRLYKFVSNADIAQAKKLTVQAWEAYYSGNHKQAKRFIRKAYRLNPGASDIYQAYLRIYFRIPPKIDLPKPKRTAPKK
ncbi:MAG: hypothetical protein E7039_09840 [Lentisphaerae bacterium]|nr:hypothetical protein [Lentisphaerota bacterium]